MICANFLADPNWNPTEEQNDQQETGGEDNPSESTDLSS
jgi:hypothetical protein